MTKQTKSATKRTTKRVTKQTRLDVRCTDEVKEEFEIVAEYRGLKPAALLHSYIVRTIRETKQEAPEIFNKPDSSRLAKGEITLKEAQADDKEKTGK